MLIKIKLKDNLIHYLLEESFMKYYIIFRYLRLYDDKILRIHQNGYIDIVSVARFCFNRPNKLQVIEMVIKIHIII